MTLNFKMSIAICQGTRSKIDPVLKSTSTIKKWTILPASFSSSLFMSTEEVLDALEKYTQESTETDRETATRLGVNQITLKTWLRRAAQPEKCMLARLAGFLRRAGYI
jgi:hypothetical protein